MGFGDTHFVIVPVCYNRQFYQNRITFHWYMAMCRFSRWLTSAILNF